MNVIHRRLQPGPQVPQPAHLPALGPADGCAARAPQLCPCSSPYSAFKYYSTSSFKVTAPRQGGEAGPGLRRLTEPTSTALAVVSKLVNRGCQPHLEDFLHRIPTSSNYYQDA